VTIESAASCSRSNWSVQIRTILYRFAPLIGTLIFLPLAARAKEVPAQIRVNQVGYETGQSGRAYLMARGRADGSKFSVMDLQGTASSFGTVGAVAGTWSKWNVYVLDFTIAKSGTYSIAVTGEFAAKSPVFKVDTPANLYAVALSNALAFYQNQRDGADFIPSDLRTAAGHLNDKSAKVYQTPETGGREGWQLKSNLVPTGTTIDASGGWWDAGDYLKFVHTASYVMAMMLVGRRDFPNQMGPGSPATDFTNEAKFGLDWLLRMWDDNSHTLYYQVGIGSWASGMENDHSIWRLPQEDDTSHGADARYRYIRNRPVFVADAAGSKISPNLAGRLAGNFALCYQIFHASNPAYANRCLLAAEHVFDLANTRPTGPLLTALPHEFYGETEWQDDLEFAATELHLALRNGSLPEGLPHPDPNFYLDAATSWAYQYIRGRGKDSGVLGVADISSLAHFDLYRALAGQDSNAKLGVTPEELLADLRKTLDHAVDQAGSDVFGFGMPWEGDIAARGLALAVMAREYDFLSKSSTFSGYAQRWMASTLGANAWGVSFIVGDGTTFPHCIHHQVANLVGSKDGQEPILAGAVVEGPQRKAESGAPRGIATCPPNGADPFAEFNDHEATYRDNAKFYSTNETAIDLTAPSFLIFSRWVAGAP